VITFLIFLLHKFHFHCPSRAFIDAYTASFAIVHICNISIATWIFFYGVIRAKDIAIPTLGAGTAIKTALGFGDCLFLRRGFNYLLKTPLIVLLQRFYSFLYFADDQNKRDSCRCSLLSLRLDFSCKTHRCPLARQGLCSPNPPT